MTYNKGIRNRLMPHPLHTAETSGTISGKPTSAISMGLIHHLDEFVSADGGADGRPTSYRVAKDAGIATNTIYRILKSPDTPLSPQVLGALCKALNVQPGELLSYEPEQEG